MPKIQIEYKDENLDKAIRLHQLRYDFVTKADAIVDMIKRFVAKGDAIVDALTRFFSKEDFDYFLEVNQKEPINQDDPDYVKKMDSSKKKVKKK